MQLSALHLQTHWNESKTDGFEKSGKEIHMHKLESSIKKVLFTREQIAQRVRELGVQITMDYEGRDLVVVGILKGAGIFMCDLIREIRTPIRIDFVTVSSYGNAEVSSGTVHVVSDLHQDIAGCSVLVVEDIIDTGHTLHYMRGYLRDRGAKDVKICTLLDKPSRREVEVPVDYTGFVVDNEFIVGYGIDFAEQFRNLPFLAVLKEPEE